MWQSILNLKIISKNNTKKIFPKIHFFRNFPICLWKQTNNRNCHWPTLTNNTKNGRRLRIVFSRIGFLLSCDCFITVLCWVLGFLSFALFQHYTVQLVSSISGDFLTLCNIFFLFFVFGVKWKKERKWEKDFEITQRLYVCPCLLYNAKRKIHSQT